MDVRADVPKSPAHGGGRRRGHVLSSRLVARGDHEPESVEGRDDLKLSEAADPCERRCQPASVDSGLAIHLRLPLAGVGSVPPVEAIGAGIAGQGVVTVAAGQRIVPIASAELVRASVTG